MSEAGQNNLHKGCIHYTFLPHNNRSMDHCHLQRPAVSPTQFYTVTDQYTVLSTFYCLLGLKEMIVSFAQGHTESKQRAHQTATLNVFLEQDHVVSTGINSTKSILLSQLSDFTKNLSDCSLPSLPQEAVEPSWLLFLLKYKVNQKSSYSKYITSDTSLFQLHLEAFNYNFPDTRSYKLPVNKCTPSE